MTPAPRVLIATGNRGKLREIRDVLTPLGFDVIGLADADLVGAGLAPAPCVLPVGAGLAPASCVLPAGAGLAPAPCGEPVENGDTFESNARIKAEFYGVRANLPVIADDSGLCVDALDGRPGVHSARYSGPAATDASNNAKLLREMAGVADRRARFVCIAVCRRPDGAVLVARGECDGALLDAPRGADGFGYDPLFLVPRLNATFAELPPTLKNEISHRGRALRQLAASLAEFLNPT